MERGVLHVIIGPMFAGKSTMMGTLVERHFFAKKRCLIIKHTTDQRFASTALCTHSGHHYNNIAVQFAQYLRDADDKVAAYDVIGIDEIHFFAQDSVDDVMKPIEKWLQSGKYIICAGLDTDWRRESYPIIGPLVGQAQYVSKLLSVCKFCGRDAQFTMRWREHQGVTDETRKELANCAYDNPVGGADKYAAVCRECFLEH